MQMAFFTSLTGVDFATADFGFYGDFYVEEGYLEDFFFEFNGTVYDDFYYVRAATEGVDLVLVLLGSGFGTDIDGFINKGTVEAVLEAEWDGDDRWYLEDVSLNLLDFLDALYFPDAQSQENLFFEALFGADLFELSEFVPDAVEGYFGDDTFSGGQLSADTMFGGPGDDLFDASMGDLIDGGEGFDTVSFELTGSVVVRLGNNAANSGDAQNAALNDVEGIIGSPQADDIETLLVSAVRFEGGLGDDTLSGGTGADTIFGDGGADEIHGGHGGDILVGDAEEYIAFLSQLEFIV